MTLSWRQYRALHRMVTIGRLNAVGEAPHRHQLFSLAERGLCKITVEVTDAGRAAHAEGPPRKGRQEQP